MIQLCYFVFLVLFAYMMLFDFKFKTIETIIEYNLTNSSYFVNETTINEDHNETNHVLLTKPSFIQYLLTFWVFTFICEEIRQVRVSGHAF